jgi:hypothetical protein
MMRKRQSREKINAWRRADYAKNPEKYAVQVRRWNAANWEHVRLRTRDWKRRAAAKRRSVHKLVNCLPYALRKNSEAVSRKRRAKIEALRHYGDGKCACCGEGRQELLSLDHVDGGGTKYRKVIGNHGNYWEKLRSLGYPTDPRLRVLCHSCNQSFGFFGYCPHELGRTLYGEA